MANFKMHLSVAAVTSGLLSTLCLGINGVEPKHVISFWCAGILGGILPDIDSDNSTSLKIIFTLVAAIVTAMTLANYANQYAIVELWFICGAVYISIRYIIFHIFVKFTVHRGIFHSLLAGAFFWFTATALSFHTFQLNATLSWLVGLFVGIGYIIHLVLDEIYAVDFQNHRVKRSFGTAFKPLDFKNLPISFLMSIAMLAVLYITPNIEPFSKLMLSGNTYHHILQAFIPTQLKWF